MAVRLRGERFRQELQRDRLAQLEVVGAVDLAHATAADQSDDAVAPLDHGTGRNRLSSRELEVRSESRRVPATDVWVAACSPSVGPPHWLQKRWPSGIVPLQAEQVDATSPPGSYPRATSGLCARCRFEQDGRGRAAGGSAILRREAFVQPHPAGVRDVDGPDR
jgi:hypothetical protein